MISPIYPDVFQFKPIQMPQYANFSNLLSFLNMKNYIQTQTLYQQQQQYGYTSESTFYPASVEIYKDSIPVPMQYTETKWSPSNYEVQINTLPNDAVICLEAQIKFMIQFFIKNFGIAPAEAIQEEREKYAHNQILLKLFDVLGTKYASSRKTREELCKWVVRKVLMTGKQNIKGGQKMDQKTLSNNLCQRYLLKQEKIENEGDSAKEVLPYKKNSRHKTINNSFREQMFESEEFQQDYDIFLSQYDEIIEKDTTDKMRKFSVYALECVKKNKVDDILNYKRMPWLKSWSEKARRIALELEDSNIEKKYWKQIKLDPTDE